MNRNYQIIMGLAVTLLTGSASLAQHNAQPSNATEVNGGTRTGARTVAGPQPGMPGNYNQNRTKNTGAPFNGNTARPSASQTAQNR